MCLLCMYVQHGQQGNSGQDYYLVIPPVRSFRSSNLDVCLFQVLQDVIMSIPTTFRDSFKGIRTYLVRKVEPSTILWNLMLDHDVLLREHVDELEVFTSCQFLI